MSTIIRKYEIRIQERLTLQNIHNSALLCICRENVRSSFIHFARIGVASSRLVTLQAYDLLPVV